MKQIILVLSLLLSFSVLSAQQVFNRDVEINHINKTQNGNEEILAVEIKNTGDEELLSPTIAIIINDSVIASTQMGFVLIKPEETHEFKISYPKTENIIIQFEEFRGFKKNLSLELFYKQETQNIEISNLEIGKGKKKKITFSVKNTGSTELFSPSFEILDKDGNSIAIVGQVYGSIQPDGVESFTTKNISSKLLNGELWLQFTDAKGFLKTWPLDMNGEEVSNREISTDLNNLDDKNFICNKIQFNESEIDSNLFGKWRLVESENHYGENPTIRKYNDSESAQIWNLDLSGKTYFSNSNSTNGLWRYNKINNELCILDYFIHEGQPVENKLIYKISEIGQDRLVLHRTFYGGYTKLTFKKL